MTTARQRIETGGLILFVVLATVGLALVVARFSGALLWAALAALLFQPLFRRLLARRPDRRNQADALTMLILTVGVVLPALLIASLIVEQAAGVYEQMRGGQINVEGPFFETSDTVLAVNGGTGTFQNVRGEMELRSRAGGTKFLFVFHLIP